MKQMASRPHYVLMMSIIALTLAACASTLPESSRPEPRMGVTANPPDPPQDEPTDPETSRGVEGRPESSQEPRDLVAAAVELSPASTRPIRENGSHLAVTVDLDTDGRTDVCLLAVGGDSSETPPSFAELSAPERLSRDTTAVSEFFFEVYLNRPDGLVLFETRRIGRFSVVEDLSTLELNAEGGLPRAVSAHFQDQIGLKEVWLVVGRQGFSEFVIERTPVIDFSVVDIDEDGISDVLKAQTAFEEGRGYETFLTWYRWNGRSYAPHATANIVRSLNSFLQSLEEHLAAGRYARFLQRSVPESKMPASSTTDEMLRRRIADLFAPDVEAPAPPEIAQPSEIVGEEEEIESPQPLHEILAEFEIAAVAFPDFLENPFPSPGERTTTVAPLRVDVRGSGTFYYRTLIVMDSNPFEGHQFRLRSPE